MVRLHPLFLFSLALASCGNQADVSPLQAISCEEEAEETEMEAKVKGASITMEEPARKQCNSVELSEDLNAPFVSGDISPSHHFHQDEDETFEKESFLFPEHKKDSGLSKTSYAAAASIFAKNQSLLSRTANLSITETNLATRQKKSFSVDLTSAKITQK